MVNAFKLAQMINEGAESASSAIDNEAYQLYGSIEEACHEVNYIIACESADIEEFYANSNAIIVEAALSGDEKRVMAISEASGAELKNRVSQFFSKIIQAVKAFILKIVNAIKEKKKQFTAWLKSKKKNKSGKTGSVKDQVSSIISIEAEASPPTVSNWNDDELDTMLENSAVGYFNMGDTELLSRWVNVISMAGDSSKDDTTFNESLETTKKTIEKNIESTSAMCDSALESINNSSIGGAEKDLRDPNTIKQMMQVVEKFDDNNVSNMLNPIIKTLEGIQKELFNSVNRFNIEVAGEYSRDRVTKISVVISYIQRWCNVYVTGANKVCSRISSLWMQRTAEYQHAIDWAVAHSTSK